jgi:hypothetical protein
LALVGAGFADASVWIGAIAFIACAIALYRWVHRLAASAS